MKFCLGVCLLLDGPFARSSKFSFHEEGVARVCANLMNPRSVLSLSHVIRPAKWRKIHNIYVITLLTEIRSPAGVSVRFVQPDLRASA